MSIKTFISNCLAKIVVSVGSKVYIFALRRTAKPIGKAKTMLMIITLIRIRSQFALPLPGDDQSLDSDLIKVVRLFFGVVPYADADDFSETAENLKEKNAEIYQWLQNDRVAKKDLEMYFRVSHLWSTSINDAKKASEISAAYQSIYQKKMEPIDFSSLSKERSALQKRWRSETYTLREMRVQRINVRMEKLALAIPWLSVVFFVSGYVHTSIFYSYFGIDISRFFSISDYLTSSINNFKYAVLASAWYIFWCIHDYRTMNAETKYERGRSSRITKIQMGLVGIGLAAGLYGAYFNSVPEFLALASIGAILCAFVLVRVLAERYFQNSVSVFAGTMSVVFFFSVIISQSYQQIADIEDGSKEKKFLIQTANEKFTDEEHTFLGGNDRYIFLLNKKGGAEIIPLGKINKMRMSDSASP